MPGHEAAERDSDPRHRGGSAQAEQDGRGRATAPEILRALCLRDGFANVGLQVSARCLV
jgi:hypothetical protein